MAIVKEIPALKWESVFDQGALGSNMNPFTERAKVPGGWLVRCIFPAKISANAVSMTFYPDPDYKWLSESSTKD